MPNQMIIEYCALCNWMHRATWMTQELFTTFPDELDEIILRRSRGGVYDIHLNGELLFSRKAEGRFPEITELKQLVRDRIAPEKKLGHADRKE